MINIAYIVNSIQNGGPGNVIRNLLHNIDGSQYNVYLITLFEGSNNEEIVNELEQLCVKVICCKELSRANCYYKGVSQVNEIVKENYINIIHSHGLIPDMVSYKVKQPCIKISTLHCVLWEDYPQFYGKLKSMLMIPAHLHYLKKLDKVVCCSQSVYEATNSLKNSTFVRNGISKKNKTLSKERINRDKNKLIYLYMGQLRSRKNIVWLLQQFSRFHNPNEYLYVLGKGDQLEDCNKFEDENIKIIGFTKDVERYLDMADIYVSASKSEGFSISVLEALDYGLGLFLSDIPSHKEVFSIDENIYLGEVFNETNFEEKIIKLRNNIDKIQPQEIVGFKQENLSAKKMTQEYMKIYEGFLRRK